MLPSISVGWQTSPWDGGAGSGQRLGRGGRLPDAGPVGEGRVHAHVAADSLGRRMLMLANWNEFGEGHFLMPSNLAGFGYVDALRNVFHARRPAHGRRPGRCAAAAVYFAVSQGLTRRPRLPTLGFPRQSPTAWAATPHQYGLA